MPLKVYLILYFATFFILIIRAFWLFDRDGPFNSTDTLVARLSVAGGIALAWPFILLFFMVRLVKDACQKRNT